MVLIISRLVTAFIDPELNCDGGQTSKHECAVPPSFQPRELIEMAVGRAPALHQLMGRWTLVAPSQVEIKSESKQFSLVEVENGGVAELAGSAKNVWQVRWTLLRQMSTTACTAPTLNSKLSDAVSRVSPQVCVHDSPTAPSIQSAAAGVVIPAKIKVTC
jgi:hypothetical protein